ncbi:MAG: TolC family protein [Kiritimatiellae bacterium]|nr:TolC family protein [Verrucomicrobiota bacterium]MBU4366800.1 TolC family protein [Verrucomicrobiota bacterium]MCG2661839.1 TolC family protein [Kiritimatiellia bacterium]
MKKLMAVVTLTATLVATAFCEDAGFPMGLALEDALRLTLERNPQIRAARFAVQAANGRRLQAGTIPNPTLSAEVEDFGGSGESRGFDTAQTTVAFEQTIELGGKRTARKRTTTAEMKLTEWAMDVRRLDVIEETTQHFVNALAAQEELALSQEAWQMAENIYQTVSNRVAAGKDAPADEAKARAELALAKLTADRARSRLTVSRKVLCAMWGDSVPAFESVRGDLAKLAHGVPEAALLAEVMTRSPAWVRWTDEIGAAEWRLRSARRDRIPDLNVGAGIRQYKAENSQAFVAGAGVELPIFNRNRGSILAAQAELERKRAEQETAQTALRVELATAHELLTTMQRAAVTMAQDALPAAEQAFAAGRAAYASGKIGYLDIQDARRSLIEMRRRQIDILAEYHHAVAQVERLAGLGLGTIKQK